MNRIQKAVFSWVMKAIGFPVWSTGDQMPTLYERYFRSTNGADSLQRLSTVYTCCNLLGRVVSTLPIGVVESDGDISKPVDSYIGDLLQQPNEYMEKVSFFETMLLNFNTRGNAYAEVVQINNRVTALWPISPDRVTPDWNNRNLIYRVSLPIGQVAELPATPQKPTSSYILHVRNFSLDGVTGLSPLQLSAIRGAKAAAEFQEKFIENGAFPSIVFSSPEKPDEAAQKRLRATADSVYSGSDNVGKILFAFGGTEVKALSLSPADAQLLESMKNYEAQISAAYGVPIFMLNGGQTPTFASAEQFNRNLVDYAFRPLTIRFGSAFSSSLLNQRLKQRIKFNLDALLEGDSQAKALYLGTLVSRGLTTPNEARAKLNLPPLPGGDVLITQSNQTTLELIENPPAPPQPAQPLLPAKSGLDWNAITEAATTVQWKASIR
jgi:HK97 family phage portal protein